MMRPFKTKQKRNPNALSKYTPWAIFTAEGIVKQKTGLLQRSYVFCGDDVNSTSPVLFARNAEIFSQAINSLGSGWAVHIETQRHRIAVYNSPEIHSPAAFLIDQERRQQFLCGGPYYTNRYYLTFTYKPFTNSSIKNVFKKDYLEISNEKIQFFRQRTDEIANMLSGLRLKSMNDFHTLSYLKTSVSPNWHPVIPPGRGIMLDSFLIDSPLLRSDIWKLGECFIPIININFFPRETSPALLDMLNKLDCEFRYVTRFICYDQAEAEECIDQYERKFVGERQGVSGKGRVNVGKVSLEEDVKSAKVELATGQVGYGHYTACLMTWDIKYKSAREKASYIMGFLRQAGFSCQLENMNAFQAFQGMMPGNVYSNIRRYPLNTMNLAHTVNLSSIWSGAQENEFLKKATGIGAPHVICASDGRTPFYLNLNEGDVGNVLVTGSVGAGKSTLLGLIEAQSRKFNQKVVIFDVDNSGRQLTMAMAGLYLQPGKPGYHFQPLRHIDNAFELTWAGDFIIMLLLCQNVTIKAEYLKKINTTLKLMQKLDKSRRTLSTFVQLVQDREIDSALHSYTVDGQYPFFDGDEEIILDSDWVMFEMSSLLRLGEKAVYPAFVYLSYQVDRKIETMDLEAGESMTMVFDEFWRFMGDRYFASRIEGWIRTNRKKHVFMIFATQCINDALASDLMPLLISLCPVKIILPDEEAGTGDMRENYKRFGLSDKEIELISSAQVQKKRDYYFKSASGSRWFRLELGPVALGLLTGKNHKALDEIAKKFSQQEWLREILNLNGLGEVYDYLSETGIVVEAT